MPVRSSVCTYSPSKMSTPTSKYSNPSSLSIGHYKPLTLPSSANYYSNYSNGSSNLRCENPYSTYSSTHTPRNSYSTISKPSSSANYDRLLNTTSTFSQSLLNNSRNNYSRYSSGRALTSDSAPNYTSRLVKDSSSSVPSYVHRSPLTTSNKSYLGARTRLSFSSVSYVCSSFFSFSISDDNFFLLSQLTSAV